MGSRTTAQIIPFVRREELYSLNRFLRAVERKKFDTAVNIIAELFLLGDALALETLGRFMERSRADPDLSERLLSMKALLEEGELEDVIRIVDDCFGIRGMDALWVIQAFQQAQGIKVHH